MRDVLAPVLKRLNIRSNMAHPSAETMAAFSEKSLSKEQREAFLTHLASCQVCRQQLSMHSASFPSRGGRKIVRFYGLVAASLCALAVLSFNRKFEAPDRPSPPGPPGNLILSKTDLSGPNSTTSPGDANVAWRFSGAHNRPSLERSRDGGRTWSSVTIDNGLRAEMLVWSGTLTWIRTQNGRMLESRDAGLHWSTTAVSVQPERTGLHIRMNGLEETGLLKAITRTGGFWVRKNGIWHDEKQPGSSKRLTH
jgi:hypothetical protein